MKLFYKDLNNYEITKSRIASVFRNISYNVFDILLVAFFEEISVDDLVSCKDYKGVPITKSLVADVFRLKDKSLRNLPRLKKKICEIERN